MISSDMRIRIQLTDWHNRPYTIWCFYQHNRPNTFRCICPSFIIWWSCTATTKVHTWCIYQCSIGPLPSFAPINMQWALHRPMRLPAEWTLCCLLYLPAQWALRHLLCLPAQSAKQKQTQVMTASLSASKERLTSV